MQRTITEQDCASLSDALTHIHTPNHATGQRLGRAHFTGQDGTRMHVTSGVSTLVPKTAEGR